MHALYRLIPIISANDLRKTEEIQQYQHLVLTPPIPSFNIASFTIASYNPATLRPPNHFYFITIHISCQSHHTTTTPSHLTTNHPRAQEILHKEGYLVIIRTIITITITHNIHTTRITPAGDPRHHMDSLRAR